MNTFLARVQSKSSIKACREYIDELYCSNGLENSKFIERHDYILNGDFEIEKEIYFISEESIHFRNEPLVSKMLEKYNTSQFRNHELMRYFKPECLLQVSKKLDSIQDLEKMNADKPIKNYAIEEGQIYVIYIWSFYKSICKKQLTFLNNTIVDLNVKCDGKVKFLSVNFDENKQYSLNILNTLKINKIENYYIDKIKTPNHPFIKLAQSTNLPICLLINTDSIIEYLFNFGEIDIESKIKEITKRTSISNISFYNNGIFFPENDKKIIKQFRKEFQKKIEEFKKSNQLIAKHLFKSTLRIKKVFTSGIVKVNPQKQLSVELNYYCHYDDEKTVLNLFQELEPCRKMKVSRDIVNTFEISYGEICCSCSLLLDEETPQYYCSSCDIYLCIKCGNMISDINLPDSIHGHFLFLLTRNTRFYMRFILSYNFENRYENEFKYFEENRINSYYNECKTHMQVKCNGCLAFPIRTERWKCCNCIFRNLCNNCKNILDDQNNEFFDEIYSNITKQKCHPHEHVFLKIVFDAFVY